MGSVNDKQLYFLSDSILEMRISFCIYWMLKINLALTKMYQIYNLNMWKADWNSLCAQMRNVLLVRSGILCVNFCCFTFTGFVFNVNIPFLKTVQLSHKFFKEDPCAEDSPLKGRKYSHSSLQGEYRKYYILSSRFLMFEIGRGVLLSLKMFHARLIFYILYF